MGSPVLVIRPMIQVETDMRQDPARVAGDDSGLTRLPRTGGPAVAAWATVLVAIVILALAGGNAGRPAVPSASPTTIPAGMTLIEPVEGSLIAGPAVSVSGVVRDGATVLDARVLIRGDLEGKARIPVEPGSGRFHGLVPLLVPRYSDEAILEFADAEHAERLYPFVRLTIASASAAFLSEPAPGEDVAGPLLVVAGTAIEAVTSLRAELTSSDGTVLAGVSGTPVQAHLGSTFSLALLLPSERPAGLALLRLAMGMGETPAASVLREVRVGQATGPTGGPSTGRGTAALPATAEFVGRTLAFDYPAGWYTQRFDYPLTFDPDAEVVPFLGTDPMRDACRAEDGASPGPGVMLTCGWPLDRLSDGGVLLTWWVTSGRTWSPSLPPGTPVVVGGQPASLAVDRPGICRALGATETIGVVVTASGPPAHAYQLTACVRGAGHTLAAAEQQVLEVLRTVTFRS